MIEFIPQSYKNCNSWSEDGKPTLWLLTPAEVESLPEGVTLTSIMDGIGVTGTDYIDLDTRFGYTAWGVHEEYFSHI